MYAGGTSTCRSKSRSSKAIAAAGPDRGTPPKESRTSKAGTAQVTPTDFCCPESCHCIAEACTRTSQVISRLDSIRF